MFETVLRHMFKRERVIILGWGYHVIVCLPLGWDLGRCVYSPQVCVHDYSYHVYLPTEGCWPCMHKGLQRRMYITLPWQRCMAMDGHHAILSVNFWIWMLFMITSYGILTRGWYGLSQLCRLCGPMLAVAKIRTSADNLLRQYHHLLLCICMMWLWNPR